MIIEEMILDRDRIECLVTTLTELLKVESHYEFKLRFSARVSGGRELTIIPHAQPVAITLSE